MKKSIALVAMAFGVTSAFAQDLTSKKGEPFLPEAGDYAVSIDATPFLNYAGNFFGKTANNAAPGWNYFTQNQTILGKYFKDANTAYRAGIRLGIGSASEKNQVADRTVAPVNAYPTADPKQENVWKQSNTNVGITVGLEKRKGKTRLQGFYGADAGIWLGSQKNKFTYGNGLVATSTSTAAPIVDVTAADQFANFNGGANVGNPGITGMTSSNARITEMKSGMTLSFGVRAFIGAEYFIAPKISLGGEFGWGIGYTMTGKSKTTWESFGAAAGATTDAVGTTEIEGNKKSSFSLDTDKSGLANGSTSASNGGSIFGNSASPFGATGNLRLTFHF